MTDFAYLSENSAIERAKNELEDFFVKSQLSPQITAKMLIVIDEIVSNIVFYGNKEHGMFTISADIKDNELILIFKDNGIRFNPLEQSSPDINKPTRERDVGGLGILIVKKMADYLSYEYRDECNILTFKKKIN